MPRPSKYTIELQTEFCDLLKQGHGRTYACKKIGIDFVTFMRWLGIHHKDSRYVNQNFIDAVKEAEKEKLAKIEDDMIMQIIQASKKYWTAGAWILERMFSDRYALKTKSEFSGYIERGESESEQKKRKQEVVEFLKKIIEDSKPRNTENKDLKPENENLGIQTGSNAESIK